MKDSILGAAYFIGSLLPTVLVATLGWFGMWHGVIKYNPVIREVLLGELGWSSKEKVNEQAAANNHRSR